MKTLTKITLITLISLICGRGSDILSQPKTDSLLMLLKTAKQDTTKIKILNDLCWELKYSHPDSAKAYCLKALKLSKKVKFKRGQAKSLNNLGAIHYLQGDYPEAVSCHQRSLTIREALGDKRGWLQA